MKKLTITPKFRDVWLSLFIRKSSDLYVEETPKLTTVSPEHHIERFKLACNIQSWEVVELITFQQNLITLSEEHFNLVLLKNTLSRTRIIYNALTDWELYYPRLSLSPLDR